MMLTASVSRWATDPPSITLTTTLTTHTTLPLTLPLADGFREPLGQLVIQAVMHLLFLPSFTVDSNAFENEYEEDEQVCT